MKLRFIFSACLLLLCALILKAQFPIPSDSVTLDVNNIKIRLVNSLHKVDQIELFGSTGRKLKHWRNIDERTFQIKKENLASGMYFLRIKLTNGELHSVTGIKL